MSQSFGQKFPSASGAAVDALDLAAGERVRRIVRVASAHFNQIGNSPSVAASYTTGIVAALSSPGLRRLTLVSGDEDDAGQALPLLDNGDGDPVNFVDRVLAAPARDGSLRTGMYVDLRGNASAPLDTVVVPAVPLITCLTCPADVDGSLAGAVLYYQADIYGNTSSLSIQITVAGAGDKRGGTYSVDIATNSTAAQVAAALATALAATGSPATDSGAAVTITGATGVDAWVSVSAPFVIAALQVYVSPGMANGSAQQIRSRGGTVLHD